ncbi:hypothetical protein Aperf_G00000109108 [Anoplocephala perfoliata]
MLSEVKILNLRVESHDDISNIHLLMSAVKPDWAFHKLQYKLFNEGTTNVLFAVYLDEPLTPNNCVLVRIFGYQTELYIERDKEFFYLRVLNQFDFAGQIYAKFINGICYSYLPGSTVNYDLLTNPKYYKMVAEKVAALHTLPIDGLVEQHFDINECVFNSALKFIRLISDDRSDKMVTNETGDSVLVNGPNQFPTKEYLTEEVLYLRKLLASAKSPLRFCHNDLLFGNIIISTNKNEIHFIDFEYSGYNKVCYDIANHFCEYSGMADYDPTKYPSREMQREWVRAYLQAFKKNSGNSMDLSPSEIEEWLDEIQNFTLLCHLYWGIWSIVQSQRSKLSFNYVGYALARLNEYKRLKESLGN